VEVPIGGCMEIFIVFADDCNENDCGCWLESIDSVWLKRSAADERLKQVYHGRVDTYTAK
jgi:hypothetical protein